MRREEREIMDRKQIDWVISKTPVFRLGLCKDGQPYIVPLSFGYDGRSIYFHTARKGLKLDYLEANPRVCFEMEHEVNPIRNQKSPCNWSQSFYSVIGFGVVREITDERLKVQALNQVVEHYAEDEPDSLKAWVFEEKLLNGTRVWEISIQEISGKQTEDKKTEDKKTSSPA